MTDTFTGGDGAVSGAVALPFHEPTNERQDVSSWEEDLSWGEDSGEEGLVPNYGYGAFSEFEFEGADADDLSSEGAFEDMPLNAGEPHPETEALTEAIIAEVERIEFTRSVDSSLDVAEERYGAEFADAFNAVIEAGHPLLAQSILSQDDPGEALIAAYRQAQWLTFIQNGGLDDWVRQRYAELTPETARHSLDTGSGGRPISHRSFPPPSIAGALGSAGPYRESIPDSAVTYAFGV